MVEADWARELLFADVALEFGGAAAQDVARALERYRESPPGDRKPVADALVAVGALSSVLRGEIEERVEELVRVAGGDAAEALRRRGGLDRDIHTSLSPRTSTALLHDGAGARAPLRVVDSERYRDFTLVGKGGMGVVYLAFDTELNRRVAFKMVRPDPNAPRDTPAPETPLQVTPPGGDGPAEESRSFEELKVRFLQEAWITGAMEHPGIVPVYELGTTAAGIPYYTMRYFKGERTLAAAIRSAGDLDERLALLEPFLKVCDAVRYAHARGVMHRDLKPDNVVLGEFGEVVVLDWGLSKMTGGPEESSADWRERIEEYRDASHLETVAGALGTPGYMAPEAVLGQSEAVDAGSDVFSLGAMLFEILTGRLPFRFATLADYAQKILDEDAPGAHEVADEVPLELSALCARALAKDKAERIESVDALAKGIRRWQTEGRLQLQIDELMETTRRELAAARRHTGNTMLWHLDRATAACTRVLHLRKRHPDALERMAEIKRLRDTGIRARVRAGRRTVVVAVGFLILAVATLVALKVASVLSDQRRDAETRLQAERRKLAATRLQLRSALQDREHAVRARAELYANLSRRFLAQRRVADARLAAARAVTLASSPGAWRALAAAEASWVPRLVAVLSDVAPGPIAFGRTGLLVRGGPGVREYDFDRGDYVRDYPTGKARLMVPSPYQNRLATVNATGAIQVWDTETGELVTTMTTEEMQDKAEQEAAEQAGRVTAAAFDADRLHLVTGHASGTLVRWDLATGGVSRARRFQDEGAVIALRPAGNGAYLCFGHAQGMAGRFDDWTIDKNVSVHIGEGDLTDVVSAAGGEGLYACTRRAQVTRIDLDPVGVFTVFQGVRVNAAFTLLSPDATRLCAATEEGEVTIWDLVEKQLLIRLAGHGGDISGFALSADGRRLAIHQGGVVRVWSLRRKPPAGSREPVTAVWQSRDGKRTLLARPDHSIEAWDSEAGKAVARWPAHGATITALVSDGERIVSASLDGTLAVWPESGGKRIAAFPGPAAPTALALSTEGSIIAGCVDGSVELYSWRRERRVASLIEPGALPVTSLAVVGDELHAWDSSGEGRAWNLATRDRIKGWSGEPADRASLRGKLPPITGVPVDWIRKDATERLIDVENMFGLKLDGATVVPASATEYAARGPRVLPWSR